MPAQRTLRFVAAAVGALVLSLSPASLLADTFNQIDLVSSGSVAANSTDPNLINPWGLAFSGSSPFWVSDQGSGVATVYNGAGAITPLVVTVPAGGPPSGPTGQVFNSTTSFQVSGAASNFIFDTLQGTIAARTTGSTSTTVVTTPGAVYTGLALGNSGGANYLYAANTAGGGGINVFNSTFAPVTLAGNFVDPFVPAGYVPFNIQLIGTQLYVTYADLTGVDGVVPGSNGDVAIFNTNGTFVTNLVSGNGLDAPWGITQAPAGFGSFGNDILVGNFGNGEIDAYSTTGTFEGALDGTNGLPLVNHNLWALDFDSSTNSTINPDALYFTAGIGNQQGGLFGAIVETPEPPPFVLVGFGLIACAFARFRLQQA